MFLHVPHCFEQYAAATGTGEASSMLLLAAAAMRLVQGVRKRCMCFSHVAVGWLRACLCHLCAFEWCCGVCTLSHRARWVCRGHSHVRQLLQSLGCMAAASGHSKLQESTQEDRVGGSEGGNACGHVVESLATCSQMLVTARAQPPLLWACCYNNPA